MAARRITGTQQTAVAEVKNWTVNQFSRAMKDAQAQARTLKGITIIAVVGAGSYLVLQMPPKTVQQLARYSSSLPSAKRQPSVSKWISDNQTELITQYFKRGRPKRFTFTIIPVPKVATPAPRRVEPSPPRPVPRRVEPSPAPRKTVPQITPPQRPAAIASELRLPPKMLGDPKRTVSSPNQPFIIYVPVPSKLKPDTVLGGKTFALNIRPDQLYRTKRGYFSIQFSAAKSNPHKVNIHDLSFAVAKLITEKAKIMFESQERFGRIYSSIKSAVEKQINKVADDRKNTVQDVRDYLIR